MTPLFKIHRSYTVRSATILTNAYVVGSLIDASDCNQLVLYVTFVKGSLTSGDIKISFGNNGINYFQESTGSFNAGTTTEYANIHRFSFDGIYRLVVPVMDNFVKIEAIGIGTVTDSSLAVSAYVGTV